MKIILRPYQEQLVNDVYHLWASGARNVIMRLDTGGGKTAILSHIHAKHNGASAVLAHRQELVSQLSLSLARYGVRHDLIAAESTRRQIAEEHVAEFGQSFYTPNAPCKVVSVDTMVRANGLESWASKVTLWTCDEGHHLVRENKWDCAIGMFAHPAVRGLLPTATPSRANGKGLGSHADGRADAMVEGPPMRWLIEQGYLTDYRIICPPSDLQVLSDPGASGDWSPAQLRDAAKQSHIVGDVVQHYLTWARGKLGVTFCTDVDTAIETTAAFRAAGVRAETLTGKTASAVRRDMLRRYRARELDQLVTVDIVSEGFDLPAIEVASMARPTQSLSLYMQQFGRALRPLPGKDRALIIDHASNTMRHGGPPDRPRIWTLDRRDKRAKSAVGGIPLRVCIECFQPYERTHKVCPHCGYYPVPAARSSPEQVDGDLAELSPEALARLRGEIAAADASAGQERARLEAKNMPAIGVGAGVNRHLARAKAQAALRKLMGQWGGAQRRHGLSDSTMQRVFYHTYGIDTLTAQMLGAADADALRERIILP